MRFNPAAEAEFAEAIRWYQQTRFDLAVDFAQAVEEGLAAIQTNPLRYPVVYGQKRRFLIRRFPYAIFQGVRTHELRTLAVYHLHRDPGGVAVTRLTRPPQ
jgi:plasmid stabilization system protein ParE